MKKTFYTILLVAVCTGLFGQDLNYDLKKYKVPETRYQSLELYTGASGYGRKYSEADSVFESKNHLSASLSAAYQLRINRHNYQGDFQIGGYCGGYLSKYNRNNNEEKERSQSYNPSILTENRFYKEKNYFFVGLEHQARFYSKKRNEYYSNVTNESNNSWSNTLLKTGYGYGRIEEVQDARLAVYILNDLRKNGLLEKEVSDEDIQNLAETIAKLKNSRGLDSRIKKMEDLVAIDAIIKELGLAKETNIHHFKIINDNWDYAYLPERLSGSRIFTNLAYEHRYGHNWNKQSDGDTSTTFYRHNSVLFNIGYNYEKPLNLKWQLSFNIEDYFNTYNTTVSKDVDKVNFSRAFNSNHFQSDIMLGYYPNSRASIKAGTFFSLIHEGIHKDEELNKEIIWSLKATSEYYFSPSLSLRASLYYKINRDENYSYTLYTYNDYLKKTNYSFNLQLVYKFF